MILVGVWVSTQEFPIETVNSRMIRFLLSLHNEFATKAGPAGNLSQLSYHSVCFKPAAAMAKLHLGDATETPHSEFVTRLWI
jgi:hypothetical protein